MFATPELLLKRCLLKVVRFSKTFVLEDYLYCLIYLARSSVSLFCRLICFIRLDSEESFVLSNMSKIMCNLFDSVAFY